MTESDFPRIIENEDGLDDERQLFYWAKSHEVRLKALLAEAGAILFRGFPVTTAAHFDAFASAFSYDEFTYADSLSNAVRVNLTPRVFTANEAPAEVEIYLHHEMAQTPISPEKLFFCCLQPAESGGATPLCRSDWLWSEFQAQHPPWAEQFRALGLRYRMEMPAEDNAGSGQGRSWASTLSAQTRAAAEEKLIKLGYRWQWQQDGGLVTQTPVLPAVKRLSGGAESFYNQVLAANLGWQSAAREGQPPVTFGDESLIPSAAIEVLIELAKRFTQPLAWQKGDIALVDNHRVMHGRYPYRGNTNRQVVVCLAREAAND
jgi:hypothetical protein